MKIGIDIDDTLLSTTESFEMIKAKYNVNFNKKLKDNWTEEERKFIYNNYLEETLKNAKLKEGAKEVIHHLNELGYTLFIITARSNRHCKGIEEFTKDFFEKENMKIKEFYFDEVKKSDLAKRLNLDLMIDDNIYVHDNMQQDCVNCILFGDKIKNWEEVLDYIKRK